MLRHQWGYGPPGREGSRRRQCALCRVQQRTPAAGLWDDKAALEWRSLDQLTWTTGKSPACFDAAAGPRETEWSRAEDDQHPRWEIRNPKGDGGSFLCTDEAIRTFGRKHIEWLLRGLPPLPDKAWEVPGD